MKIFSAQQIRKWDEYTIFNEPIASIDLMERAASACTQWILSHLDSSKRFYIFCGKGNNGGDGLAIARQLQLKKINVSVFILETDTHGSADFRMNLERLRSVHSDIHYIHDAINIPDIPADVIVIDALFGTGINRPLEGLSAAVVEALNRCHAQIISIDMPSGLMADHSSVGSPVVQASFTLSFQSPKLAFFMPENENYVGDYFILDIGLDPAYEAREISNIHAVLKTDIRSRMKTRPRFAHKGNFGHALIVAGSYGKIGAAVLASRACLRTGAGLLTTYIPSCGYHIMQSAFPEAMVITDAAENEISHFPETHLFHAIAIGPGMGISASTQHALREFLIDEKMQLVKHTMVLDADALNMISMHKELLRLLPAGTILTPHPKEFERLFGRTADDFKRMQLQVSMSEAYKCYILLKGHYSMLSTPDGQIYINTTGNPGMATAGSGDVLTGMICGLLAQGYHSLDAAMMGMYLHGSAGDLAAKKTSQLSLIASDIIDHIGEAIALLYE
jgi:NAD(P)H-hydrate epimerase